MKNMDIKPKVAANAPTEAYAESKDSKKKKVLPPKVNQVSSKATKSAKLRPSKEVANATQQVINNSHERKTGLFSQMEVDPWVKFMFDTQSLMMLMAFEIRGILTQALQSTVKAQADSAITSADLKREQGKHESQRIKIGAIQGMTGAAIGMTQTGFDVAKGFRAQSYQADHDHTVAMTRHLEDGVFEARNIGEVELGGEALTVDALNQQITRLENLPRDGVPQEQITARENAIQQARGAIDENGFVPEANLQAASQELALRINEGKSIQGQAAANEFNEFYDRRVQELVDNPDQIRELSKDNEFSRGVLEGLTPEQYRDKVVHCAERQASREAFENLLEGDHADNFRAALTDAEVAKGFMDGLAGHTGDGRLSAGEAEQLRARLSGSDQTTQLDGRSVNIRNKLMRKYGRCDRRRAALARQLQHHTENVSKQRAARESESRSQYYQRSYQIQTALTGMTKTADIEAAKESVAGADAEAESRKLDAASQNYGAARNTIESQIAESLNSLKERFKAANDVLAQNLSSRGQSMA